MALLYYCNNMAYTCCLDLLCILIFAWEQRKLKDIAESYSGGTPSVGQKSIMKEIFPLSDQPKLTVILQNYSYLKKA